MFILPTVYTQWTKPLKDFLAFTCLFFLLKTFASSLDPDQTRQNAGSNLDQNCLTLGLLLYDLSRSVFFQKMLSTYNICCIRICICTPD